jgi:hypothetical protein
LASDRTGCNTKRLTRNGRAFLLHRLAAMLPLGETSCSITRSYAMRKLILIVCLAATGIVLLFFVPRGTEFTQLILKGLGFCLLLGAVLAAGHKIAEMNSAKSEPFDSP